jgi:hypothetical protein
MYTHPVLKALVAVMGEDALNKVLRERFNSNEAEMLVSISIELYHDSSLMYLLNCA